MKTNKIKNNCFLRPIWLILFLSISTNLFSQIATDGTLSSPAQNLTGPDYSIGENLGHKAGGNLFHSFSVFNINSQESATFTGSNEIENVVSRVTGGNSSTIDGLIKSEITGADFYFINPAGIIFGPNANLDVSGSLHISSSDYIGFGADERFYTNPLESSVLSTASPTAFGFLDDTVGSIEAQGAQLKVKPENTLSLIGGDIELDNVEINAKEGQVNLISVSSEAKIDLAESDMQLDHDFLRVERMGIVKLFNNSNINVSGSRSGRIFIRAGELLISNRSRLSAETKGSLSSKDIGEGNGGSVMVETDGAIRMINGGQIVTSTLGEGDGGDVLMRASSIELDGGEEGFAGIRGEVGKSGEGNGGDIIVEASGEIRIINDARISADTEGEGNGGDVAVEAGEKIRIINGGQISVGALGKGDAGDVLVKASSVELDGGENGFSRIRAGVGDKGEGNGGNVIVEADEDILMINGGEIAVSTLGKGDTGDVLMKASSIAIDGGEEGFAGIRGEVRDTAEGNGGDMIVEADKDIHIINGGRISADTEGQGNGGQIIIGGPRINLSKSSTISTTTTSIGNAGEIIIGQAAQLALDDNNQIKVDPNITTPNPVIPVKKLVLNDGSIDSASKGAFADAGKAGTIKIAVTDEVRLENNATLSTSTANSPNDISQINAENATILIQAPNLVYLIDSKITTSIAGGNSPGGNISIDPEFVILNNSSLTANAFGGPGGNINIITDYFFQSSGSILSASSQKGIDGQINISSPDIDLSASLIHLPQNYLNVDTWIMEKCAALMSRTNSRLVQTGRHGIQRLPQDLWPSQLLR